MFEKIKRENKFNSFGDKMSYKLNFNSNPTQLNQYNKEPLEGQCRHFHQGVQRQPRPSKKRVDS